MNVWTVVLLTIVSVGLILYFLVVVVGVGSDKLFGLPLIVAVIIVIFVGFSYYLLCQKLIYVVIKSDENVLYKNTIKSSDKIWHKDEEFRFSSKTRGIPVIDYRQQVKDFLASEEDKLCRDYKSHTIGSGRYTKEGGLVTVCVDKKGLRWYF